MDLDESHANLHIELANMQPVVAIDSILRRLDFSSLQQVRPMPRSFCQDIHAGNEWFLKQICRFGLLKLAGGCWSTQTANENKMVPGPWWYSCCKPVFASGNLVIDFLNPRSHCCSFPSHALWRSNRVPVESSQCKTERSKLKDCAFERGFALHAAYRQQLQCCIFNNCIIIIARKPWQGNNDGWIW